MDTRFTEIDPSEVQSGFPKFYDKQGRFFEIIHQEQPIGFAGVRPLQAEEERNSKDSQDCELEQTSLEQTSLEQASLEQTSLEVFIFRQYRNALTKGIVLATLDLPKSLGFKRCVMKTSLSRVVKLLNSMGKYGIIPVSVDHHSHVFVRKFE